MRGEARPRFAGCPRVVLAWAQLDKTVYRDLGADYFDRLDREAVARRLTKRLEALGYKVDLQDLECAA